MKGIYILFSGGYDSGFLVNNILKKLDKNNCIDTEVNLISVNPDFSYYKSEREHDARKRLVNYWKSKYYKQTINYQELRIYIEDFRISISGLSQPLFWISSLMMSVDLKKYDEIDIMFSYIQGDQSLYYRKEIEDIVNSSLKIKMSESIIEDGVITFINVPKVNIRFPLAFIDKTKIIPMLIYDDEFIFDNCTTCENRDDEDFCGKCVPCTHLKETMINILSSNNISDNKVKSKCKEVLNIFEDKIYKKKQGELDVECDVVEK